MTAIPYRIRRSDRARRARILVDGDGIEVVVPQRFPLRDVEPFVEEKRAWIERTLRRMRETEAELPPARLADGRQYLLCWVLGEPAVEWWHWPDTGFAGRRPLSDPPA